MCRGRSGTHILAMLFSPSLLLHSQLPFRLKHLFWEPKGEGRTSAVSGKCLGRELWRNMPHLTPLGSASDYRVWAISGHISLSVKSGSQVIKENGHLRV